MIIASVHQAEVLGTYDFVDVVDHSQKIGWQVKSTKKSTPVTWKRAKIPERENLIKESMSSMQGCQKLGNAMYEILSASISSNI